MAALLDDPLWYKDAVVYQVHVRGYFDSDDDGIGDFAGLTKRLDYIQSLGVSAIWILPFYPSPLRDDGYDIAHYEGIHPSYGTRRDFRTFLDAAHDRGLRVVTELVINHTSDQHPWFQAARRARPGSAKRNFYVWSDTDERYAGVRIIFSDMERSNWTWDPVAGQYFWHRFFHHQPDLNFDNPRVRKAVAKVMRFWLDQGVDGMRLDAVPYLIEREGTECANLPETHEALRELRAAMDAHYANRMLLAEANLWPTDVVAYFGEGDECHMAFNFPLMPRLYMALRQEDRHPISEILYQTPEIPETCQWAIFLRNHDELTLEMVTDEERDYMYQTYAADPQMRLNAGIRRRLAPLMENSRARVELLNGLLLSLPGTPIIYYGDEIGMGDNVYIGDRNGVRTPMQWTADRNGGFSRADPARLYAPTIMDPVYGYQSVNVESQERSPHSLLNWMRRLIALRQRHRVFGRGSIELLRPENRRIFAFIRRMESEDPVLVVANMARSMQPAALDLSRYAGLVPIEMSGGTDLPRITDGPYFLTLAPHGFYWLLLKREAPAPVTVRPIPATAEAEIEQLPMLLGAEWSRVLAGKGRTLLERSYLAPFLRRQRWFQQRATPISEVRMLDWGNLREGNEPVMVTILSVKFGDGQEDQYLVPLAMLSGAHADEVLKQSPDAIVARIGGATKGILHGALDAEIARELFGVVTSARTVPLRHGQIRGSHTTTLDDIRGPVSDAELVPATPASDRTNSSIRLAERFNLKLLRRTWPGINPEIELGQFFTEEARFPRTPRFAGAIDYEGESGRLSIAVLQAFLPHQMEAWHQALGELQRYFESAVAWDVRGAALPDSVDLWSADIPEDAQRTVGGQLEAMATMGRRTAELHMALAGEAAARVLGSAALDQAGATALIARVAAAADSTLTSLAALGDRAPAAAVPLASQLLERRNDVTTIIKRLERKLPLGVQLTRIHGTYDLEQVLLSEGDYVIIDFDGDPGLSIDQRRQLETPFKDVATMVRSLQYAAAVGLASRLAITPQDAERMSAWARWWHTWTAVSFLRGYRVAAAGQAFLPAEDHGGTSLLRLLMIEQALTEIRYEIAQRPEYLWIPIEGLLELMT